MQTNALTNLSPVPVISSGNPALSAAKGILDLAGFKDQQSEIQAANINYREHVEEFRDSLKAYESKPADTKPGEKANQRARLRLALDAMIKLSKKEITKSEENYTRFASEAEADARAMSSGKVQWLAWLKHKTKYHLGLDSAAKANHYEKIVKKNQAQLKRLRGYSAAIESDVNQPASDTELVENNHQQSVLQRLQALPTTNEISVSTHSANIMQQSAALTILPNGRVAIAWRKDETANPGVGDVYLRIYSPGTTTPLSEVRVNVQTSGSQGEPTISATSDNKVVVCYDGQDDDVSGIFCRIFDGTTGAALTGEMPVNSNTENLQTLSSVAVYSSTRYLVLWSSNHAAISDFNIHGGRFGTSDGIGFLPYDVRINSANAAAQMYPVAAALSNGHAVGAWASFNEDTSGYGVYGCYINTATLTPSSAVKINTIFAGDQSSPAICILPNDRVAFVWESQGTNYDIYFAVFSTSGGTLTPLIPETRVNNVLSGDQRRPSCSALPNSDIVFVYKNGSNAISIRRYNYAANTFYGSAGQVNSYMDDEQHDPVVRCVPNSYECVTTWTSFAQDGPNSSRINARNFQFLTMGNNAFVFNGWGTTTLTSTMLDAASGGTASQVRFSPSSVTNGRFALVSNPAIAINQFTKQQVIDSQVIFVSTSNVAPTFTITVTDGNETLSPVTGSISFSPGSTPSGTGSSSSSTGGSSSGGSSGGSSTADSSSTGSPSTGSSSGGSSTADSSSAGSTQSSSGGTSSESSTAASGSTGTLDPSTSTGGDASTGISTQSSSTGIQPLPGSSTGGTDPNNRGNSTENNTIYIIVGVLGGLLIIGVTICGVYICKQRIARSKKEVEETKLQREQAKLQTRFVEKQKEAIKGQNQLREIQIHDLQQEEKDRKAEEVSNSSNTESVASVGIKEVAIEMQAPVVHQPRDSVSSHPSARLFPAKPAPDSANVIDVSQCAEHKMEDSVSQHPSQGLQLDASAKAGLERFGLIDSVKRADSQQLAVPVIVIEKPQDDSVQSAPSQRL